MDYRIPGTRTDLDNQRRHPAEVPRCVEVETGCH